MKRRESEKKKTRPIGQRCVLSVSRYAFCDYGSGSGGDSGIGGASGIGGGGGIP